METRKLDAIRKPAPRRWANPICGTLLRTYQPRLLVVEDDPDICAIARRVAEQIDRDIIVDQVPDARSAVLRMSETPQYDVILADFLLEGDRSGYWLQSQRDLLQPRAEFLMMSALPLCVPTIDEEAFIRKPFSTEDLKRFLAARLHH